MAPPDETPEEELRGIDARTFEGQATSGMGVAAQGRTSAMTALTIFFLVVLGSLAIVLIPRLLYSSAPKSPPVGLVLGVGLGVTAVSSAAIYAALAFRKRFWWRVVIFTLMFNAIIALVGFTLGPEAVHNYTLKEALTPGQLSSGLALTAISSFLMFALAALIIYRVAMKRVHRVLNLVLTPNVLLSGLLVFLGSVTIFVVLVISFFTSNSAPIVVIGVGGVFGLSIVVGVAASIIVEIAAFRAAENRAIALRNASVLTSLFWVALAILAGYHIAWVIYVLWLTSTWPLKAPSGC